MRIETDKRAHVFKAIKAMAISHKYVSLLIDFANQLFIKCHLVNYFSDFTRFQHAVHLKFACAFGKNMGPLCARNYGNARAENRQVLNSA